MLDIFLLIGLAILQILDGMSTYEVLKSQKGVEANVLMKWLFERIGVIPTFVVTKTALMGVVIAACLLYPSIYLSGVLVLIIGGYLWVVSNNLKIGG